MFAGRGATVLFRRVTQAASRRAFSSGGGSSKRFGWKSKLAAVAITGAGAYNVTYHLTHPAPENEIIQDMLLAQTTKDQRKERLVVLGTGWGAVALLSNIDPFKYEVICISPRNHFVMTPLLPSVTVGTVEPRTVVESIRNICPHVRFVEAECTSLDPKKKTATFSTVQKESSSRAIKDEADARTLTRGERGAGAKFRPDFELAYDKLVIAVGAENNTFNTPGVEKHAHFLKEIIDARRIRAAILDAFESAANPGQTEEERKRLLNFVVVGGGPTGVEFAAELADLLHEDLKHNFPKMKDDVKIQLVEATETVLSMFDKKISEYTEENFKRENIDVLGNTFVKEVKQKEVLIQRKGKKEIESIPCSLVVWATGIRCRPIVNKMREAIGLGVQNNFRALVTDRFLAVKGAEDIFSLGDCATIQQERLAENVEKFFDEADQNKDGAVSLNEFREWTEKNMEQYPQLQFIASSEAMEEQFRKASTTRWPSTRTGGLLKRDEFKKVLESADRTLRVLPATAQVAAQEGKYLAKHLNLLPTKYEEPSAVNSALKSLKGLLSGAEIKPFQYRHLGSLAYIGGDAAAADLRGVGSGALASVIDTLGLSVLSGKGTYVLWRSFYLSEQFSTRTKMLLAIDWVKSKTFGRDVSRY